MRALKRKTIECTHGLDCYRASFGKCWFKHSQPVTVSPHRGQMQQHNDQGRGQGESQRDTQLQGQGQWEVQGQRGRQGQGQGQGRQGQGQGQQGQEQGRQGQGNHQRHQGQSQGQFRNVNKVLYCRYQERCHNSQSCKFKHIDQGFPQIVQGNNQQ